MKRKKVIKIKSFIESKIINLSEIRTRDPLGTAITNYNLLFKNNIINLIEILLYKL